MGFLTGHILRRHLYVMELNPRVGGVEQRRKYHLIFRVSVKLRRHTDIQTRRTHRHTYLGSFSLDPEDVRSISLGKICNFIKRQESHGLDISLRDIEGLPKVHMYQENKGSNGLIILCYSITTCR